MAGLQGLLETAPMLQKFGDNTYDKSTDMEQVVGGTLQRTNGDTNNIMGTFGDLISNNRGRSSTNENISTTTLTSVGGMSEQSGSVHIDINTAVDVLPSTPTAAPTTDSHLSLEEQKRFESGLNHRPNSSVVTLHTHVQPNAPSLPLPYSPLTTKGVSSFIGHTTPQGPEGFSHNSPNNSAFSFSTLSKATIPSSSDEGANQQGNTKEISNSSKTPVIFSSAISSLSSDEDQFSGGTLDSTSVNELAKQLESSIRLPRPTGALTARDIKSEIMQRKNKVTERVRRNIDSLVFDEAGRATHFH